jgi:hypothetical protein
MKNNRIGIKPRDIDQIHNAIRRLPIHQAALYCHVSIGTIAKIAREMKDGNDDD